MPLHAVRIKKTFHRFQTRYFVVSRHYMSLLPVKKLRRFHARRHDTSRHDASFFQSRTTTSSRFQRGRVVITICLTRPFVLSNTTISLFQNKMACPSQARCNTVCRLQTGHVVAPPKRGRLEVRGQETGRSVFRKHLIPEFQKPGALERHGVQLPWNDGIKWNGMEWNGMEPHAVECNGME